MRFSNVLRNLLPAVGSALPVIILFVTLLSVPLAAAQQMELSAAQTSSWVFIIYAFTGVLSLSFAIRYRQPLVFTGNIFILIFVASLAGEIRYSELIGASLLAGVFCDHHYVIGNHRSVSTVDSGTHYSGFTRWRDYALCVRCFHGTWRSTVGGREYVSGISMGKASGESTHSSYSASPDCRSYYDSSHLTIWASPRCILFTHFYNNSA